MNPEDVWDSYAAKFGPEEATKRLGTRPSAQPTAPVAPEPSRLQKAGRFARGALSSVAQGGTLGTSDEVAGGLAGLAAMVPGGESPNEAYERTRDAERESVSRFRKDHGALAFGAELVGGIATGGAAGRALGKGAAGVRAASRGVGRVIAEGAAAGGVTGAATAEGGVRERIRGGAVGAAAGAAFGGALHGAGKGLGRFLDVFGLRPKGGQAAAVAGQPGPSPTPAARPSRFARAVGTVVESADDRANRKVLEAMERDQIGVDDVRNLARTSGKPVTVMDAGDPEGSVVGLARAAKSIPGPAKKRFAERFRGRAEGTFDRILGDLETGSGLKRQFTPELADDIVKRRAMTYGPQFEAALDNAPPIESPELAKLLASDRGSITRGIAAARKIAAEEGRKAFEEGKPLNARDLHYLKLGVDDVLRGMRQTGEDGGSRGTLFSKMVGTKEQLLAHMDDAIPGYQQARQGYAGESALRDALERGRDEFMRTDSRQIAADLASMTVGEQEMYRRGGVDAVMSTLSKKSDTANLAHVLDSSPDVRNRVRALFDSDDAAEKFMEQLGLESRMNQSRAAFQGSRTAELQAEQADLLGQERFPTQAPTLTSLAVRGVQAATEPLRRRLNTDVSEALADRLSTSGPDLERVLKLLEEYGVKRSRRAAAGAAGTRGAAVAGGATAERVRSGR